MTDIPSSKCIHKLHENGIHEFILTESTLVCYEEFLLEVSQVYAGRNEQSPTMRSLIDSRKSSLPISYAVKRGKETMDKFPNIGKIRTATLTDSRFETHLVDSFLRIMRFQNMRVRFFDADRREDAAAWLLQDN
jgi:hypothetical protein